MDNAQAIKTLFLVLDKSQQGELSWKTTGKKGRLVTEINKWRLLIETTNSDADHPFRFAVFEQSPRPLQIGQVRSIETEGPLTDDNLAINKALRELFEVARPDAAIIPGDTGAESLAALNRALGKGEATD